MDRVMHLPSELRKRIDAYLDAAVGHSALPGETSRRELRSDLETHILDALAQDGGGLTEERLDGVLGRMDPPESFRPDAAPVASAERAGEPPASNRPRSDRRWIVMALAFFALNGWGVWRMTRAPAPSIPRILSGPSGVVTGSQAIVWTFSEDMAGAEPGPALGEPARLTPPVAGNFVWSGPRKLTFEPAGVWPGATRFEMALSDTLTSSAGRQPEGGRIASLSTEPLDLRAVEQAGLSADREVTVRLRFNVAPDPATLAGHVTLRTAGGKDLAYERVGEVRSADVLLRTAPLMEDGLQVAIRAGLRPASGDLVMPADRTHPLAVSSSLRFARMEPQSPPFESCHANVYFTEAVDMTGAAGAITVEPRVAFTVEPLHSWSGSGVTLRGAFEPGATYEIAFDPVLRSTGGSALGEEVRRRVQFPNRPPSLAVGADGRYLSPKGPLRIPLTAVNVRKCEVSARPLPRRNLVYFVMREQGRYRESWFNSGAADEAADQLTGAASNRTVRLDGPRNQTLRETIDLREFTSGEPLGAWLVTARAKDAGESHRLVVVTDIGLSVKVARDGAWVWAVSLRHATPVSGARVTLLGRNNSELGRRETDADGLAFIPLAEVPEDASPLLAVAEKAGDLSYLALPGSETVQNRGVGGRPYLAAGFEAFVYTDRGIYRPGETVHIHSLVRNRDLEAPEPFPVVLRVRRPDGRILRDLSAVLDDLGSAGWSLPVEEYHPTGRYTVELALPGTFKMLGETSIAVEDFVPPQIEIETRLPDVRLRVGEAVIIPVAARHLFGRAADGLAAEARVGFEPMPFQPKGWDGWTFGDAEREFAEVVSDLGRHTLNAEGRAQWKLTPDPAWRPPAALKMTAGVTVIEASGRPVSAWVSAPVDPTPHYLGIRAPSDGGVLRVGEPAVFGVARVAPDGSPLADGGPLKAAVSRVEWSSALRRNPGGTWSWRSERTLIPVAESVAEIGAGGSGETTLRLTDSGDYLLVVSDVAGVTASARFVAAAPGAQWVSWEKERADRVDLEPDRTSYAPGDRARIAIKTPYEGLALVTLESDRVLERRVIRIGGTAAVEEFDILPEYGPNVYCGVSLLRPAVPEPVWSAHRAFGYVSLKVIPPGRRLAMDLTAPDTIRPAGPLEVLLSVRDESGAPARASITVAAVDEGICRLTDFQPPDPLDFFLGTRRLSVLLHDLYRDLMPLIDESVAGASHTAGDGGMALGPRLNPIKASRFRPVALWASGLQAGDDGEAKVVFDVPEFTGRLRVMAVAYDRGRAGSASAAVTVKRPLVVQAGLPRFLSPGDRCDMTVQVYNESDTPVRARIQTTTQGPLAADRGVEELDLDAGARGEITVPLTAGAAPGLALCAIEVVAGDERYVETIEMAVRPAAPRETTTLAGVVEPNCETRIEAPDGWLPESISFEAWTSGLPDLGLAGGLDYLLSYPYGCLEQVVSGGFPLLVAADLANAIRPDAMGDRDADVFVREAILRVLSVQQSDGAFQVWPNSGDVAPWTSIYAAHFLIEARRAGYDVPADRVDAALEWMRGLLDRSGPANADEANIEWQDDQERRAYICHALALAQRAEPGWTARVLEQAPRLRASTRAHLAHALIEEGRPRDAAALLRTIEPSGGDLWRRTGGCFNSAVRDAALPLSAWSALEPAAPEAAALAHKLLDARRAGRWMSTQENAAALVALGRYAAARPREEAAFAAVIRPSAGEPAPATGDRVVRWSSPGPGAVRWLRIENEGPGRCYFGVTASGVPVSDSLPDEDHGLRVRRDYLRLDDGKPWGGAGFRQGDLVVVRIRIEAHPDLSPLEQVVIEDLLPAGFEIENPAFELSGLAPWLRNRQNWLTHRDVRDDRLILFPHALAGSDTIVKEWHYTARAVTPGRFAVPPIRAEAMYDPAIRSRHGRAVIEVVR